jgi:hypothetical protein
MCGLFGREQGVIVIDSLGFTSGEGGGYGFVRLPMIFTTFKLHDLRLPRPSRPVQHDLHDYFMSLAFGLWTSDFDFDSGRETVCIVIIMSLLYLGLGACIIIVTNRNELQ